MIRIKNKVVSLISYRDVIGDLAKRTVGKNRFQGGSGILRKNSVNLETSNVWVKVYVFKQSFCIYL